MFDTALGWLYPYIHDGISAKKAANLGFWAAMINAVFCFYSGVATTGSSADKVGAISIGALFLIVGAGILKMSRAAAIAGFLLCLVDFVLNLVFARKGMIFSIFLIIWYVHGIRGAFLYHREFAQAG